VADLPAGRGDTRAAARDPHDVQSPPALAPISPETLSQAGAGALLVAVAITELWLAFWAAGWWHRSAGLLVGVVGAAVLARAIVAVARPLRAESATRRESISSRRAPAAVALAEWAQP
jgi:hypothetical protein